MLSWGSVHSDSQWENSKLAWLPYVVLMKKVEIFYALVVGEQRSTMTDLQPRMWLCSAFKGLPVREARSRRQSNQRTCQLLGGPEAAIST